MQTEDAAIDEIKALENRRYRAMIAGDAAVLDELCSDDLIYTHSKGRLRRQAELSAQGRLSLLYLPRDHASGRPHSGCRWRRARDRKNDGQRSSVAGTIVHVDNRYLAVWVREHGAWKFVAYQPTPIIDA